MPNFWTNIRQQAYECLNGPRTKDYDFDKKLEELNQTKTKINQVKSIMLSFPTRTAGLLELCEDIIRNLPSAFFKDNSYYPFIDDVACAHKAFQDAYLKCRTSMEQLQKDTQTWDKIFEGIEIDVRKRNDLRKVYDHYDDKLEEMVKERNAKLVKNKPESTSENEKFERNEKKWRDSTSQYVNQSNHTYKRMQDLLDSRYNLMVPIIMTFVTNERLLFINLAKIFNYFENCQCKWQQMTSQYKKQKIDYNALDFVRGRDLLNDNEVNTKRITNLNTVTTGVIGGNLPPGSNKKPPNNMGGGEDNINQQKSQQPNTFNDVIQGNQMSSNQPINNQPQYPPQKMPGPGQNQEYPQQLLPPNQFIPQPSTMNQPPHSKNLQQYPQKQPINQSQYQQFNQNQPNYLSNPQQKFNQSSFPQQPNPEIYQKYQQQYQQNQGNPYQPDISLPQNPPQPNENVKEFNPYIDKPTDD